MRYTLLTALTLTIFSSAIVAQPAGYAPRGVRAYLVNYGAVHGDRFLAEFSARRFVLIDEAGAADIPMMRAIAPDIPVLRYRDMVAVYPSFPEFAAVDRDEQAFMHSTEPSALLCSLSGDTATIAWMPDRRTLPIKGYRLQWSTDSLGPANALVDTLITAPPVSVRLPKSAVFLRVDTELEDGSLLNYGFPVRWSSAQTALVVWPAVASEMRTTTAVDNHIELRAAGEQRPDSVFIIADTDRSNTLSVAKERLPALWTGDRWVRDFSVDITGLRSNCGYEFAAEIWSGGKRTVLPAQGKWHTNVNNRVKNDTYGFYVMNVGSSTWRQATISQILLAFSRQGYSGLFEDDCWYRVENYGGDSYPPVPYNELEWRADLYGMLDSIRTAIAPRPAYFNGLYTVVSDSLLTHTEGGMTEGFAYTHWSGLVRGANWRNSCNRGLSAAHAYGKTWMSLGGAPFDDIPGRLYTLASYLMAADSLSMFANATSYQELSHFPEFDIPLGQPIESAELDIDTLAHDNGAGRF
ncbi:MAG: putative glycoside hydrolase, partial [Bacteroidota bacterium]